MTYPIRALVFVFFLNIFRVTFKTHRQFRMKWIKNNAKTIKPPKQVPRLTIPVSYGSYLSMGIVSYVKSIGRGTPRIPV